MLYVEQKEISGRVEVLWQFQTAHEIWSGQEFKTKEIIQKNRVTVLNCNTSSYAASNVSWNNFKWYAARAAISEHTQ